MSKSLKPKNDNEYIDSKGIVHNKQLLSEILEKTPIGHHYTYWAKSYTFEYSTGQYNIGIPQLIIIHWSQSQKIYIFYRDRLMEIYSNLASSDTITTSVDTTNKTLTFNLSNTGVVYRLEMK